MDIYKKYPNYQELLEKHPETANFLLKLHTSESEISKWTVHDYQVEYSTLIEGARNRGKNVLITMPTGMGKTMALYYALSHRKTIYVTPSVALTEEKYEEVPELFPHIRILRDTGSDRQARKDNPELFDYENRDLIVTTNERLLYMIGGKDESRIFDDLEYIVFDEIHKIGNVGRGSKLERVLMKLKEKYPEKMIIGLSATLPNYGEFGGWLDAEVYFRPSEDRPVPLIPIYSQPVPANLRKASDKREHKFIQLKHYYTVKDGQYLVFLNSKREIDKYAYQFAEWIANRGRDNNLTRINVQDNLDDLMKYGVAKHYRNIELEKQKEVIERFNNGEINIIFCTTTLAEGVNTSATNVVIFDFSFWRKIAQRHEVNTYDQVVQIMGRAGRPNMGIDEGRAIFLGDKNELETARYYVENPQPARSQFARVLIDTILDMIVNEQCNNINQIVNRIKQSFLVYQVADFEPYELVEQNLIKLKKYKLIDGEIDKKFWGTDTGRLTIKQALPVYSVIDFYHRLYEMRGNNVQKFQSIYDIYRLFLSNEDILAQINYDEKRDRRNVLALENKLYSDMIIQPLPINLYDKDQNKHILIDHSQELLKFLVMVFYKDMYPKSKYSYEGMELTLHKQTAIDHIKRMATIFKDDIVFLLNNTKEIDIACAKLQLGTLNDDIAELIQIEGFGIKTVEKLVQVGITSTYKLFTSKYSTLKRMKVGISEQRFEKLKSQYGYQSQQSNDDYF